MKVYILEEAGYTEALYGLGFSFGLTSHEDAYTEVIQYDTLRERLEKRAHLLAGLGKGHDKFLRQIIMWVEVDAPLYWWKQMDSYISSNGSSLLIVGPGGSGFGYRASQAAHLCTKFEFVIGTSLWFTVQHFVQ